MNVFKTTVLLVCLTLLLILVGGLVGGRSGMVFALVLAAVMNFTSYWFSDKIVLKIYRAQKIEEKDDPRLYRIVRTATQNARLPMPQVYVIPTDSPNAFATGRNPNHAAVVATHGILKILDDDELEGVISHELAHIKNRDILTASVVATIAGAIGMLAFMARWAAIFGGYGSDSNRGGGLGLLVTAIVAPIAAMLIQLAISRSREYAADQGAASISHKPLALAQALEKLQNASKRIPLEANPSTAHLFIVNPLRGGGIASLFSTHPPVKERVARLRKMARGT